MGFFLPLFNSDIDPRAFRQSCSGTFLYPGQGLVHFPSPVSKYHAQGKVARWHPTGTIYP